MIFWAAPACRPPGKASRLTTASRTRRRSGAEASRSVAVPVAGLRPEDAPGGYRAGAEPCADRVQGLLAGQRAALVAGEEVVLDRAGLDQLGQADADQPVG